jgi:hypothetical protein
VYALAHPSLRLTCGAKPKLTKTAASDVGGTIKSLFSTALFNQLVCYPLAIALSYRQISADGLMR